LLCLRNARAFPLLPAALASVPFGFVLVRVRVREIPRDSHGNGNFYQSEEISATGVCQCLND